MFNFGRRINGRTYYVGFLVLIALTIALLFISGTFIAIFGEDSTVGNISGFSFLAGIVIIDLIYGAALIRQRANDISGKHPLLVFILLYFTPLFIVGGLLPGERHDNRYGAVPPKKVQLR